MPARKRAIWRHSSEPIEPAAPVTSTERPAISACTRVSSRRTCCRPSRSWTDGFRTWADRTLPLSSSSIPGTVLHGICAAWQLAKASRICAPLADRMAIMISPTVCFRRFNCCTTENAWRPDPRTGMPMIRASCFSGSSSRKPFTSYSVQRLEWTSRTSSAPAAPAP